MTDTIAAGTSTGSHNGMTVAIATGTSAGLVFLLGVLMILYLKKRGVHWKSITEVVWKYPPTKQIVPKEKLGEGRSSHVDLVDIFEVDEAGTYQRVEEAARVRAKGEKLFKLVVKFCQCCCAQTSCSQVHYSMCVFYPVQIDMFEHSSIE